MTDLSCKNQDFKLCKPWQYKHDKGEILKYIKETNQTKCLAVSLDLLINQRFLPLIFFIKFFPREQERKTTKKGWEKYLSLSKEEKKKSNKMGVSNIKISMKMIKRRLVKYRKIYYKIRKNTSV